ncbi:MAG: CRISPR-associated endonuclease Cas1 [Succinivibrionaceae bacterium]|nr:CRISPR-associated endonuclease Cas1 [Succinivibrionaceae bacterium]
MELVLDTYGVSLSRDNEGFVIISDGEKQRIPVSSVDSIQVSRGAQITSDAVLLAIEHEIGIVFVDRTGSPKGLVWSPRYGSVSTIRKGQLAFTASKDAVRWIKDVLVRKIGNQKSLILSLCDDGSAGSFQKSLSDLDSFTRRIKALRGGSVSDISEKLRGIEGQSARIYFSAMNAFLPASLRFKRRTQHPAKDAANAFLNYCYGMLYSQIEEALIKAGIDPYIGILHRDDYRRPAMVFDVIEPYRIWADYVVYTLLSQGIDTDGLCSIEEKGSCCLEPLGRRIITQSFNDYLDEVVTDENVPRSRRASITIYVQSLAQKFKGYAQ